MKQSKTNQILLILGAALLVNAAVVYFLSNQLEAQSATSSQYFYLLDEKSGERVFYGSTESNTAPAAEAPMVSFLDGLPGAIEISMPDQIIPPSLSELIPGSSDGLGPLANTRIRKSEPYDPVLLISEIVAALKSQSRVQDKSSSISAYYFFESQIITEDQPAQLEIADAIIQRFYVFDVNSLLKQASELGKVARAKSVLIPLIRETTPDIKLFICRAFARLEIPIAVISIGNLQFSTCGLEQLASSQLIVLPPINADILKVPAAAEPNQHFELPQGVFALGGRQSPFSWPTTPGQLNCSPPEFSEGSQPSTGESICVVRNECLEPRECWGTNACGGPAYNIEMPRLCVEESYTNCLEQDGALQFIACSYAHTIRRDCLIQGDNCPFTVAGTSSCTSTESGILHSGSAELCGNSCPPGDDINFVVEEDFYSGRCPGPSPGYFYRPGVPTSQGGSQRLSSLLQACSFEWLRDPYCPIQPSNCWGVESPYEDTGNVFCHCTSRSHAPACCEDYDSDGEGNLPCGKDCNDNDRYVQEGNECRETTWNEGLVACHQKTGSNIWKTNSLAQGAIKEPQFLQEYANLYSLDTSGSPLNIQGILQFEDNTCKPPEASKAYYNALAGNFSVSAIYNPWSGETFDWPFLYPLVGKPLIARVLANGVLEPLEHDAQRDPFIHSAKLMIGARTYDVTLVSSAIIDSQRCFEMQTARMPESADYWLLRYCSGSVGDHVELHHPPTATLYKLQFYENSFIKCPLKVYQRTIGLEETPELIGEVLLSWMHCPRGNMLPGDPDAQPPIGLETNPLEGIGPPSAHVPISNVDFDGSTWGIISRATPYLVQAVLDPRIFGRPSKPMKFGKRPGAYFVSSIERGNTQIIIDYQSVRPSVSPQPKSITFKNFSNDEQAIAELEYYPEDDRRGLRLKSVNLNYKLNASDAYMPVPEFSQRFSYEDLPFHYITNSEDGPIFKSDSGYYSLLKEAESGGDGLKYEYSFVGSSERGGQFVPVVIKALRSGEDLIKFTYQQKLFELGYSYNPRLSEMLWYLEKVYIPPITNPFTINHESGRLLRDSIFSPHISGHLVRVENPNMTTSRLNLYQGFLQELQLNNQRVYEASTSTYFKRVFAGILDIPYLRFSTQTRAVDEPSLEVERVFDIGAQFDPHIGEVHLGTGLLRKIIERGRAGEENQTRVTNYKNWVEVVYLNKVKRNLPTTVEKADHEERPNNTFEISYDLHKSGSLAGMPKRITMAGDSLNSVQFEYALSGKGIASVSEIRPGAARVQTIFDNWGRPLEAKLHPQLKASEQVVKKFFWEKYKPFLTGIAFPFKGGSSDLPSNDGLRIMERFANGAPKKFIRRVTNSSLRETTTEYIPNDNSPLEITKVLFTESDGERSRAQEFHYNDNKLNPTVTLSRSPEISAPLVLASKSIDPATGEPLSECGFVAGSGTQCSELSYLSASDPGFPGFLQQVNVRNPDGEYYISLSRHDFFGNPRQYTITDPVAGTSNQKEFSRDSWGIPVSTAFHTGSGSQTWRFVNSQIDWLGRPTATYTQVDGVNFKHEHLTYQSNGQLGQRETSFAAMGGTSTWHEHFIYNPFNPGQIIETNLAAGDVPLGTIKFGEFDARFPSLPQKTQIKSYGDAGSESFVQASFNKFGQVENYIDEFNHTVRFDYYPSGDIKQIDGSFYKQTISRKLALLPEVGINNSREQAVILQHGVSGGPNGLPKTFVAEKLSISITPKLQGVPGETFVNYIDSFGLLRASQDFLSGITNIIDYSPDLSKLKGHNRYYDCLLGEGNFQCGLKDSIVITKNTPSTSAPALYSSSLFSSGLEINRGSAMGPVFHELGSVSLSPTGKLLSNTNSADQRTEFAWLPTEVRITLPEDIATLIRSKLRYEGEGRWISVETAGGVQKRNEFILLPENQWRFTITQQHVLDGSQSQVVSGGPLGEDQRTLELRDQSGSLVSQSRIRIVRREEEGLRRPLEIKSEVYLPDGTVRSHTTRLIHGPHGIFVPVIPQSADEPWDYGLDYNNNGNFTSLTLIKSGVPQLRLEWEGDRLKWRRHLDTGLDINYNYDPQFGYISGVDVWGTGAIIGRTVATNPDPRSGQPTLMTLYVRNSSGGFVPYRQEEQILGTSPFDRQVKTRIYVGERWRDVNLQDFSTDPRGIPLSHLESYDSALRPAEYNWTHSSPLVPSGDSARRFTAIGGAIVGIASSEDSTAPSLFSYPLADGGSYVVLTDGERREELFSTLGAQLKADSESGLILKDLGFDKASIDARPMPGAFQELVKVADPNMGVIGLATRDTRGNIVFLPSESIGPFLRFGNTGGLELSPALMSSEAQGFIQTNKSGQFTTFAEGIRALSWGNDTVDMINPFGHRPNAHYFSHVAQPGRAQSASAGSGELPLKWYAKEYLRLFAKELNWQADRRGRQLVGLGQDAIGGVSQILHYGESFARVGLREGLGMGAPRPVDYDRYHNLGGPWAPVTIAKSVVVGIVDGVRDFAVDVYNDPLNADKWGDRFGAVGFNSVLSAAGAGVLRVNPKIGSLGQGVLATAEAADPTGTVGIVVGVGNFAARNVKVPQNRAANNNLSLPVLDSQSSPFTPRYWLLDDPRFNLSDLLEEKEYFRSPDWISYIVRIRKGVLFNHDDNAFLKYTVFQPNENFPYGKIFIDIVKGGTSPGAGHLLLKWATQKALEKRVPKYGMMAFTNSNRIETAFREGNLNLLSRVPSLRPEYGRHILYVPRPGEIHLITFPGEVGPITFCTEWPIEEIRRYSEGSLQHSCAP